MVKLRPYQQELIQNVREAIIEGNQRVCAVLGCGGGKSVIAGMIAKSATDKGNRVLFLVHRRELCSQISATFEMVGVDFGLCDVSMVQTVSRRLKKTKPPALILVDEAHHILSNSYRRILDGFPNALVLGFTATPQRMNEGGLGDVFDKLIPSVSTKWLIENNYLAPYRYFSVPLADTDGLHTRHGDFDKAEIKALMNKSAIFGDTVENWLIRAEGTKTIVYCSSIATSKATAAAFNAKGISACHLDGTTPQRTRERVVEDFRNGRITVLTNVDLFGEGFDVPDCECVVLLRPTKSLALHIQQSMRSMRYKEGKTALILDHVGNFTRHGMPDDDREWSLDAKKRKKTEAQITVRQCKNCFYVYPSSKTACPNCGLEVQHEERGEKETVEGVLLQEVSRRPYQEYTKCDSWGALELFRKAHKCKFLWSIHKAKELGIPIPSKYNAMRCKLRI